MARSPGQLLVNWSRCTLTIAAADRLGHLVRAEDGVREAVRQLETIAAQHAVGG